MIILILIICNIIVQSCNIAQSYNVAQSCNKHIKYAGSKEIINAQLDGLISDLSQIYNKLENRAPINTIETYNPTNYGTTNYDTINYDENYDTNTNYNLNTKTKTDIIKDIIREYNNNIDYYKVRSHEIVNNHKYVPGDKIYLNKVKYLLNIGHLPEGHFFLKNGKIVNA